MNISLFRSCIWKSFLFSVIIFAGSRHADCCASSPSTLPPVDISEAMVICDEAPLQPVEGVWNFPEDNMSVMVRLANDNSGNISSSRYAVTVLFAPDVRLSPGDTIGWIDASADPSRFRMTLFTRRKLSTLMQPAQLLAELSSDGANLKVKSEKWSLKLSRISFLPNFFRSIKLQHDDPLRLLPVGLTKVYPHPDKSPSSNTVRYL